MDKIKNHSTGTIVKMILVLTLTLTGIGLVFLMSSGKKSGEENVYGLIEDDEFGGVYFDTTIEGFNDRGFSFGDSVDISFSNGFVMTDIPYYNGYYSRTGEALLVGYPGYPHIKAAINNGDSLWEILDAGEGDTAVITLHEKEKYLDIQEARDIVYYDDREKYATDQEFANFREVTVGNIKPGILYRSASPCDNQHSRASYVDSFIKEVHVDHILDLADTKEKIDGYIAKDDFASPYFLSLYEQGKVDPISINTNYRNSANTARIASGLINMIESEGPYLVHCTEGKDRTGFVIIFLEALCGGTYEECLEDYMITYRNYYGIDEEDERYDVIVENLYDDLVDVLTEDVLGDYRTRPLQEYAYGYLEYIGLTDAQIDALIQRLTE